MENIRKHKDVKLVKSQGKYAKYMTKPNFKYRYPFSKELLNVAMGKTETNIGFKQESNA